MNKSSKRKMNIDKERRAMPSKRMSTPWTGHPEACRHTQQRPGEAIPRTGVNFKDVLKYLP